MTVLVEDRAREHHDHDREQGEPDNGLQLEDVDEHAADGVDLHDHVIARPRARCGP